MTGIVNYGAGNIFSLKAALDRIGVSYEMVDRTSDMSVFDRFIIPGVGHAGTAMERLRESGMAERIPTWTKPVLGICVGMQLMTQSSEEGDSEMLGLFPLPTLHFANRIGEKVPHMGWNQVQIQKDSPLFTGLDKDVYFYFVHSYFIPFEEDWTSASSDYGLKFSAAVERENFYGVQFHPEKSGPAGEQLLSNFCKLT
jgi:glutamine amidotransferase